MSNRREYFAAYYHTNRADQRAKSFVHRQKPEIKEMSRVQQKRWREENREPRLFAKKLGIKIAEARKLIAKMDAKKLERL